MRLTTKMTTMLHPNRRWVIQIRCCCEAVLLVVVELSPSLLLLRCSRKFWWSCRKLTSTWCWNTISWNFFALMLLDISICSVEIGLYNALLWDARENKFCHTRGNIGRYTPRFPRFFAPISNMAYSRWIESGSLWIIITLTGLLLLLVRKLLKNSGCKRFVTALWDKSCLCVD